MVSGERKSPVPGSTRKKSGPNLQKKVTLTRKKEDLARPQSHKRKLAQARLGPVQTSSDWLAYKRKSSRRTCDRMLKVHKGIRFVCRYFQRNF